MAKRLYNGILACTRDNDLVPWHIKMLDSFGREMQHCLYYGQDQAPLKNYPYHVLPMRDTYESLPVKVWAMLKHALTLPGWDIFIKSDCNGEVTSIDWAVVDAHEFVGAVQAPNPDGSTQSHPGTHMPKVAEQVYAELFTGPLPLWWVAGPAYTISRRVAQLVVDRGVWFARSNVYEDACVSLIAADAGIRPAQGITFISDELRKDPGWRQRLVNSAR